ncbi:MAG: hypothetical protein C4K49_06675 [Candidatus Thorarchaeota archaeon]|nr:MAG: hypothetical protein C4K49_06675 [Candidatus Thorarchaeota archaeon]
MSEIPLAPSEGYGPPKEHATKGCGKVAIIVALLVTAVIVVAVVVPLLAPQNPYQTRSIQTWTNEDVELYTPTYYRWEFSVASSEVQTSTVPDLHFLISTNRGSDVVSVTIHIAVYEMTKAVFDSYPTWAEVEPYLLSESDHTNSVDDFINLRNYASDYVWVVWFEAASKTSVWSVGMQLMLRYNWQ